MSLNNLLNASTKPHALIFVESKLCSLDDFIKEYMKSIVENAKWKNKIDTNTYYDVIKIDGYKSNIKKDEILRIIQQFQQSAVEIAGVKFYIIYGIEFASQQAVNALLKFLEEPPTNTYAILTTRTIDLVLPTIKSRCQVYIVPTNEHSIIKQLSKYKFNDEEINIIKNTYYDINELIGDIESKLFIKSYSFAKELIAHHDDLIIVKQLADQFKKMDYQQIYLVLKIISNLIPNNVNLYELIQNVNFNPIKILIFDNL
jgi:DNA polymerase-3 subunit delta'